MKVNYVTATTADGFREFFLDEEAMKRAVRLLDELALDSRVRQWHAPFVAPWGDTFTLATVCPASDSGKPIGVCRCAQCKELRTVAREIADGKRSAATGRPLWCSEHGADFDSVCAECLPPRALAVE